MIKLILISAILILNTPSSQAKATNKTSKRSKHPCFKPKNIICQDIVTLTPSIPLDFALKISDDIFAISKKYNIEKRLLIAIAKQESNFRLEVVREVNGLILKNGIYEDSKVGSDFCMMQINAFNIRKLKFDANRLITDSRYCIEAGAKILSWAKKFKNDPKWYTRYNALSAMHREIYFKHLQKHLDKIQKIWSEVDSEGLQVTKLEKATPLP